MQTIWVISKRELSGFFDSLMAYIIIVVFLGLSGFFTWLSSNNVFFTGQAQLFSFFGISYWTLFFFIPAITMRSLAEEKKTGTIELLATKPITELQIVVGKWLASWILIAISLAPTLIYYVTLMNLGNVDHGGIWGGYLALLLISGVYVAIGIFTSSITNNQIVAFILALFVSFFFQLLFDVLAPVLPSSLSNFASYLSFSSHFEIMSRGVFALENALYFVSVTALGIILATASLKRRVWS
jgi:ABC-2 type transport system permease protein